MKKWTAMLIAVLFSARAFAQDDARENPPPAASPAEARPETSTEGHAGSKPESTGVKQGVKEGAHAVKEGAVDAAHAVKHGVAKAAHGASHDAKSAAHAVGSGAKKLGHAVKTTAVEAKDKVKGTFERSDKPAPITDSGAARSDAGAQGEPTK
jgi:hypothetical protein